MDMSKQEDRNLAQNCNGLSKTRDTVNIAFKFRRGSLILIEIIEM